MNIKNKIICCSCSVVISLHRLIRFYLHRYHTNIINYFVLQLQVLCYMEESFGYLGVPFYTFISFYVTDLLETAVKGASYNLNKITEAEFLVQIITQVKHRRTWENYKHDTLKKLLLAQLLLLAIIVIISAGYMQI